MSLIPALSRLALRPLARPTARAASRALCADGYDEVPIKGTKTHENLKSAFSAKSMAVLRFEYYAQKADVEGYTNASAAFRAAAESAKQQAFGHFEFLEEVGDPATDAEVGSVTTNLQGAVASEMDESERMYPSWANMAQSEQIDDVSEWFTNLSNTSMRNANALQAVLDDINKEYGFDKE
eukprot:CAMPEP_0174888902 /NCGR_PEP_ID=MMETSP0167-20121228/4164_1 /TAXON_ID=38298 /ORGANISM="Rhodella maculata, Strain CCMP736" /LENGTH=180 /DNA_ID=CAMNT_0016126097 /DNA_START=42 /DNA_END=584 /DNA_ORIENTATION=-